jgi:threonine dehydrogenase-like Zn-dependent dehydrogenase
MKGLAVFPSTREVRLVDQPEPRRVGPTEVRLRIREVGICGTDREIASGFYGTPPAGSPHLIIGHESLAEVVEVGNAVTGHAPGDLAVLMVRRPCPHDHCRPCRSDRQDFCITGDYTERGIKQAHGFMTEFVVEDERYVVNVPRALREVGVLVEPLTIAEKAAEQLRIIVQRLPGDLVHDPHFRRAVVLGAGPVGLLGAMKLVAGGFDTVVYSKGRADSPNAGVAAAIGARFVSSDTHTPAELATMLGSIGIVYEATGVAKVSFDVMSVLGNSGIFVFTGVPGRKAPIELDAELIMRNIVLNNQVVLGTVNAGRASFEEAVRDLAFFMEHFPAAVRRLITARVPLDKARDLVLSPPIGIKSVITVA